MASIYVLTTVLPATQLVATDDEPPVFSGEAGLDFQPVVRGKLVGLHGARYLHIRADRRIGQEWYGEDIDSLHQVSWRSTYQYTLSDRWNLVTFANVGLFSDFRGPLSWRDLQTSGGMWGNRTFEHWTVGLGALAVQRPGTFQVLPVLSASYRSDHVRLSAVLPTNLALHYVAGSAQVGLETATRLGTYHVTSEASPDSYSAFTTLLVGPTASWTAGDWTLKGYAQLIALRRFRNVVDDQVDVVEPAGGVALGLRVDWKLPPLTKPDDDAE